jgi:23S rRNA (guanine745-N1)-methyltransferase
VRGCGEALALEGDPGSPASPRLACPRGHAFDRARSGYWNLLQPQDRRSKNPGDPKEAVQARRRFLEAGHEEPFLQALLADPAVRSLAAGSPVLDLGCGEGTALRRLAADHSIDPHGLDLSTPAIDLAARSLPDATWIVANADRTLPYATGAFALALSLTARQNAPELHRILTPTGRLLVAVPAADDLLELRQEALGEGHLRDRIDRTAQAFAPHFQVEHHQTVRWQAHLDPQSLTDALTATYRSRTSRQERTAGLASLTVTLSRELFRLLPS